MGSDAPPARKGRLPIPGSGGEASAWITGDQQRNDDSIGMTSDLAKAAQLQLRIAESIGVSEHVLRDPLATPNAVPCANDRTASEEALLSIECLDLIDAYITIADPDERRRCLAFVRQVSAKAAR